MVFVSVAMDVIVSFLDCFFLNKKIICQKIYISNLKKVCCANTTDLFCYIGPLLIFVECVGVFLSQAIFPSIFYLSSSGSLLGFLDTSESALTTSEQIRPCWLA